MNTLTKIQATCLLLCFGAAPVFAQTSGATSTSGSTSNSGSQSGSNSVSGAGNGYVGQVSSTSSSGSRSVSASQSGTAAVTISIDNSNGSAPATTANQGASGSNLAQTSGSGGDPQNINYSGTQTIKTNPSIQAPSLTTTLSDTCMGSMSIGLSFPGFGATGGTTLVDQACVRRLDAREFRAMGMNDVALALLCQSEANRRAVESAGHMCPGMMKTATAASTTALASAEPAALGDDEKYRDPLVRQRMGLPPLPTDKPAAK